MTQNSAVERSSWELIFVAMSSGGIEQSISRKSEVSAWVRPSTSWRPPSAINVTLRYFWQRSMVRSIIGLLAH